MTSSRAIFLDQLIDGLVSQFLQHLERMLKKQLDKDSTVYQGLIKEIQTTAYLGKPSLLLDILFSQASKCSEGKDKGQI